MSRNLDAYCQSMSSDRSMWMGVMEFPRPHTWLARMPVKKSVIFQGKSTLFRTRHRDRGYVWSRAKCPTGDQKEPTGFPSSWYFFQVSQPSPDQQGYACERHDFLLFLRSSCIFSLDNIPRSFHLGSLNFCVVVTQSIMGWICVHIAHIRSSCFLSSHELSLPGSPETRRVLPNCTMVGRHARSSHSPVEQNIVSCTPLQRCYPNAQS